MNPHDRYVKFLYLYEDLYLEKELQKSRLYDEPIESMRHVRQQTLNNLYIGLAMVQSEIDALEKKQTRLSSWTTYYGDSQ